VSELCVWRARGVQERSSIFSFSEWLTVVVGLVASRPPKMMKTVCQDFSHLEGLRCEMRGVCHGSLSTPRLRGGAVPSLAVLPPGGGWVFAVWASWRGAAMSAG